MTEEKKPCLCTGARVENNENSYQSDWTLEEGRYLMVNDEYSLPIKYCPLCGKKIT